MKRILFTLLALTLLTACGPAATPTDSLDAPVDSDSPPNEPLPNYFPRPGDKQLQRGEVLDLTADLLAMESFPVQYALLLRGNLPTPCHELRLVFLEHHTEPKVELKVYSVTDPNAMCVQVLQPFEQSVNLGSFPAGHYTVWVNGEQVAEFDS